VLGGCGTLSFEAEQRHLLEWEDTEAEEQADERAAHTDSSLMAHRGSGDKKSSKDIQRSLLDNEADAPAADAAASQREEAAAGLRLALDAHSGSTVPASAVSPSGSVAFSTLSGGDDLASPSRAHAPMAGHAAPLPASSPPAFLRESSPSASPEALLFPATAGLGLHPHQHNGGSNGGSASGGAVGNNGHIGLAGAVHLDHDDNAEDFTRREIWRQRLRELVSLPTWMYFVRHSVREIKKRRCNYALGLFSSVH